MRYAVVIAVLSSTAAAATATAQPPHRIFAATLRDLSECLMSLAHGGATRKCRAGISRGGNVYFESIQCH
jgi:hypothetical protein